MKLEDALKTTRFDNDRHKAALNVMYTAYWLKSNVSTAFKEMGLTAEQFNVMRILKGKHPEQMCVRDIASRMLEKSSNVPRIADRLILKKLIKRTTSKEDKRETLLSLTEKGLTQLEEMRKMVSHLYETSIGLDAEESQKLNELLEKMRKTD